MDSDNRFQSASLGALAAALAKAQAVMQPAAKSSSANIFKGGQGYKYADLAECLKASQAALSPNGLSIAQTLEPSERGMVLRTTLLHSSGEWIASEFPLQPAQNTPQGLGSAITYARRYSLSAICGLASDDDDGAEATRPTRESTAQQAFNGGSPGAANNNRIAAQPVGRGRRPALPRSSKPMPQDMTAEQQARAAVPDEPSQQYSDAVHHMLTASTQLELSGGIALASKLEHPGERESARRVWAQENERISALQTGSQAVRDGLAERLVKKPA